jgi:hypothetical protein
VTPWDAAKAPQWTAPGRLRQLPARFPTTRGGHPLCPPSGVVKLGHARPYRPLPPWQAIGARTYVQHPVAAPADFWPHRPGSCSGRQPVTNRARHQAPSSAQSRLCLRPPRLCRRPRDRQTRRRPKPICRAARGHRQRPGRRAAAKGRAAGLPPKAGSPGCRQRPGRYGGCRAAVDRPAGPSPTSGRALLQRTAAAMTGAAGIRQQAVVRAAGHRVRSSAARATSGPTSPRTG